MKLADLTGLILIGIVVIVTVGFLIYKSISRRAGINQADMKQIKHDRTIVLNALLDIDRVALQYRDIDSPLATEVRAIVERVRKERDAL